MHITSSDALKLIGDLAIADMAKHQVQTSAALRSAHKSVELYLGTKIEFKIKPPEPFYAGPAGKPI